jgi:polyisoprenyl-phosphate glycosyltransferase
MPSKITILTPCFNDWDCLYQLAERVKSVLGTTSFNQYKIFVVDDCSSTEPDLSRLQGHPVEIIHLNKNLGHQKAIAIGLSYLNQNSDSDLTVVMDVDGEDKPEHLPILLEEAIKTNQKQIVFARRTKRKESFFFKIFYKVYKNFFILLTGKVINFGNYSVIPKGLLDKVTHISDIWNHYPGGLMRSRLPYQSVGLERGERFTGKSKMNVTSLVVHGLSSIAVYIDTVSVRLLIGISTLFLLVLVVLGITFLSISQITGTVIFISTLLIGIVIQAFLSALILVFTVLSYRVNFNFLPAVHFQDYIQSVEKI